MKLISGSNDKRMLIWETKTGKLLNSIANHTNGISKLKFKKDILISCSKDNTLLIFCIKNLKDVTLIKNLILNEPNWNHSLTCNAVDISDKYLFAGLSKDIGVWNRDENFSLLI